MKRLYITLSIMFFLSFIYEFSGAQSYLGMVLRHETSSIDLKGKYPYKYQDLYDSVSNFVTVREYIALLSRKTGLEMDDKHNQKLVFIASPRSISIQKKQHKDWVPILVNDTTLHNGRVFFNNHERYLRKAYEQSGVEPSDIIAILNWESRLGKHKGKFFVFKLFVGQYFYIDEIEEDLFEKGAYTNPKTMPRHEAIKRLSKIKSRARKNLSQLIIQSKNTNFDPFLVKGSWAGAIGIPQFMPTSMKYARDGDKNGIIDLNSMPDAILSVASYLQSHGYHQNGKRYAFMKYNPDDMYVRGVKLYSDRIKKLGVKTKLGWTYSRY